MSRHATAELLSAYLDEELSAEESRRVAEHLGGCRDCRDRLGSLRRVSTSLRRLERLAPPPIVAEHLERRIALAGRPAGRLDRLEERLKGAPQSSSVLFTFALVTALAVLIYFFAHGVERTQRPRTALVVATSPQPAAPAEPTRVLAGRTFDWDEGVWRERGLEQRVADFHVAADSTAGREILAVHPELGELRGRVVLRLEGSVVELRGVGE